MPFLFAAFYEMILLIEHATRTRDPASRSGPKAQGRVMFSQLSD